MYSKKKLLGCISGINHVLRIAVDVAFSQDLSNFLTKLSALFPILKMSHFPLVHSSWLGHKGNMKQVVGYSKMCSCI